MIVDGGALTGLEAQLTSHRVALSATPLNYGQRCAVKSMCRKHPPEAKP